MSLSKVRGARTGISRLSEQAHHRRSDTHCGLADDPPRAPPQASPTEFRELQYVNDLEFVHDPGPAEPVWSAD